MQTGISPYRITLTVLLVFASALAGLGQTKLQVITKTIEKSFTASPFSNLKIEGEKSTINVNTWNKNEVKVVLKLISKSPDKDIAERELAFQRYILEKRKETIYMKNYLATPKSVEKLSSIQVSIYDITIPKGCKIEIINQYGDVQVADLFGILTMEVKYGKIKLENLNAAIKIQSYFGDLLARNIDGQMEVIANHTRISLDEIAGDIKLNSTLGDVFVGDMGEVKSLEISASKADITLGNPDYRQFKFSLQSKYGDIMVPAQYEKYFKVNSRDNKSFIYQPLEKRSAVSLKTSFGNIIAK